MEIFATDYIDSIKNWGHIHQLKSSKIDEALLDAYWQIMPSIIGEKEHG
jgi:hypothetical protein